MVLDCEDAACERLRKPCVVAALTSPATHFIPDCGGAFESCLTRAIHVLLVIADSLASQLCLLCVSKSHSRAVTNDLHSDLLHALGTSKTSNPNRSISTMEALWMLPDDSPMKQSIIDQTIQDRKQVQRSKRSRYLLVFVLCVATAALVGVFVKSSRGGGESEVMPQQQEQATSQKQKQSKQQQPQTTTQPTKPKPPPPREEGPVPDGSPAGSPTFAPTQTFAPSVDFGDEAPVTQVYHVTPSAPTPAFALDAHFTTPHVVYADLHFRRVCATIQQSVVCLTIRYPFTQPEQHATKSYPDPFDADAFDGITQTILIDGELLEQCRTNHADPLDHAVKSCLELHADAHTLTAVLTKRPLTATRFAYFGTRVQHQMDVLHKELAGHVVLIIGSRHAAPAVTRHLSKLWQNCHRAGIRPVSRICGNLDDDARYSSFAELPHSKAVTLATIPWELTWNGTHHQVPTTALVDLIKEEGLKDRTVSIVIEPPMPYTQEELFYSRPYVSDVQEEMAHVTWENIQQLPSLNITVGKVLVLDGSPSWFPTVTGAPTQETTTTPSFDLGSHCRGPLPQKSALTLLNGQSRQWYTHTMPTAAVSVPTWEFANLLATDWSQTGSTTTTPDCHAGATHKSAQYEIAKFLVLAALEDVLGI